MTILILIFGEIIPKTVAKVDATKFSLKSAPIMFILMGILVITLTYIEKPIEYTSLQTKAVTVEKFKDNVVKLRFLAYVVTMSTAHNLKFYFAHIISEML